MHISLKANELLYINAALMRPDRKVTLEIVNNAVFLLESYVMQEHETSTPMRQLYFAVQTMMIGVDNEKANAEIFDRMYVGMLRSYRDHSAHHTILNCKELVQRKRYFEAMKLLRRAFCYDDAIMGDRHNG